MLNNIYFNRIVLGLISLHYYSIALLLLCHDSGCNIHSL